MLQFFLRSFACETYNILIKPLKPYNYESNGIKKFENFIKAFKIGLKCRKASRLRFKRKSRTFVYSHGELETILDLTEHRTLQNKIFPSKCRWNGNQTRLAFRDNQSFKFPKLIFGRFRIFRFDLDTLTSIGSKKYPKYNFRSKI